MVERNIPTATFRIFLRTVWRASAMSEIFRVPASSTNGATGQREGAQEYYIFYAQDEWRATSNVVLNYGLRYEYYAPLREVNNLNVQFDITCKTTPNCILPTNHSFSLLSKITPNRASGR